MGHYLQGPAEVMTRLFPRHNFQRDARIIGSDLLIEVRDTEIPTSPIEGESDVRLLSHVEAIEAVSALRVPAPPAGEEAEDA